MLNLYTNFLMWFIPLGIVPIDEMYAWSNNEKIHILFHKINEVIKATNEYDKAFVEVKELLTKIDEDIKEAVYEKLNEWTENGSLRSILNTKKILLVGDSYLYGSNTQYPERQNYGYFLAETGFNITRLWTRGGGFGVSGDNGKFYDLINNYNNDNDSFTDILFLGGTNDAWNADLSLLKDFVTSTIDLTHGKFKNALIHIGYISQDRRNNNNPDNVITTIGIYKKCCLNAHCSYINNAETMLKNGYLMSNDGLHPSVEGQVLIANYLTSYLISGNLSTYQYDVNYSFITDSAFTSGTGNIQGTIVQNNNIVTLTNSNSTAFSLNEPSDILEWNGWTNIILGRIPNSIIWGQTDGGSGTFGTNYGMARGTIGGYVSISFTDSPDIYHCYPATFTVNIKGDQISVAPMVQYDISHYMVGRIKQINILPFTLVFDALSI